MRHLLVYIVLFFLGFHSHSQFSIRYNYFENDFSPYETYNVESFVLNGEKIDHTAVYGTSMLVSKLKNRLGDKGLSYEEQGDVFVVCKLKVDTLPIGFQRPQGPLPQDVVSDLTIEIFDREYKEKLFTGNIYGRIVENNKNGRNIKKIYKTLFDDLIK